MKRSLAVAWMALLIPALAAQSARARPVDIKEDNSGLVTGFWVITQDTYDRSHRNPPELRRKIMLAGRQGIPNQMFVNENYHIYAECGGNSDRPVRQRLMLSSSGNGAYTLICR